MPVSGRAWRSLSAVLVLLGVAAPPQAGPVWFTDGTTVSRLQTETGALTDWKADAAVRAIAPDGHGGAWIVRGDRLVRVTADVAVAVDVPLAASSAEAVIAGDPHNGGVWVAAGERLRLHAADGVAVVEWSHEEAIESVAVGGPDAMWVAAGGAVVQYRIDGQPVRSLVVDVDRTRGRAALVADRPGGYLWYVAGLEATLVDVLGGMAVRHRVVLPVPAIAIGIDPVTGALWVLYDDGVQTIGRDGIASRVQRLPADFRDPRSLARDPATPLAWLGDVAGLAALNPAAAQWFRVTTGAPAVMVAVPPFAIGPVLWRDTRAGGGTLRLAFGARCAAAPCADTARYVGAFALQATIDGIDVSAHFVTDHGAGTATLLEMPARFGDAHALIAAVTDAYGIQSEPVVIDLPIDREPTVRPKANALPVASITAPANNAVFVAPAAVTINATASDADGTIAKVEFLRNGVLLATDTSAPYGYAWSGVPVGTYVLTVRAYDNAGATATSTAVTIQVKANVVPAVRITAPATNATYTAPATIAIAATATDSDGTIGAVDFHQGATKIGTDTAAPYAFTWTNVPGGTYSLTARATDDKGAVGTSAAITVRVNKPPTASVTAPANNSSFVAPVNVTLQASATDADGTIARVEFLRNGALLATDTAAPYSFVWNNAPIGAHAITVRATDNLGAATTSAVVTVNIVANQLPTVAITSPASGATLVAGVPATVSATASDPDGTIARVAFHANDGASTALLATDTSAPYGAPLRLGSGSYVLTAVATDSKGATTTSAPVPITVAENTPPRVALVAPVDEQVYVSLVPPDIALTATAADGDGQIAEVRFYMQPNPLPEDGSPTLLATVKRAPYTAAWPAVPHTGTWSGGIWLANYEVWAEATDDAGGISRSDIASITVVDRVWRSVAITLPREPLWGGVGFIPPATVVLSAAVNQPVGAGPIGKVEFLADASPIGTAILDPSTGEYMLTWRDVPAGTKTVVARVTEADGTTVDSAPLPILVRSPNIPPVVTVTAPANGQFFEPLFGVSAIPVAATATDADGTVGRVTFLDNGRQIAADDAAPYTATLPVESGHHVITATARDDGNAEAVSLPVFGYVPLASRAPFVVITSPVANSTVNAGTPVTIAADIVAPDGDVEMVEFYDGQYSIGRKTSPPWTLTTGLFEGVHALRVFAAQAFAPDTWSAPVLVNVAGTGTATPPTLEFASPADDQVYLAPATVPLSVTFVDPALRIARVDYLAGTQVVASSSARPFGATWTNVAAGQYSLVASARFDGTAKATASAPRSLSVRKDEFVEFVAPAAGANYAPGERIALRARAGLRAGVARIDFLVDGNVIGSVAPPGAPIIANALFHWDGATVGPHAVEARAYASDGTGRSTLPVPIAVANLAVAIVEPYAGQVHYSPGDVRIMASAAAGTGAVAQVDFYADGVLLGSATTAPYIHLWTGATIGVHTVSARASNGAGTTVSAAPVSVSVVAGGAIAPDAGIDGSSIASDTISFEGTVQAPANAAVIVNGRHAPHDRNGRFYANNVTLKPGANSLTLVLNAQDAEPVTKTISVTSTATSSFRVWLDEYEGLVPFAPTLTIGNPANLAFQRIEVDMQDDGSADATLATLPDGVGRVSLHYATPGIYTVRVTVFGAGGSELFRTRLRVKATAPAELAAKVIGVYRGVTERLAANNATGALDLFAGDARSRYAEVFAVLGGSLPGVAAQLGTPIDGVVTGDWAELTLLRPTPEGDRAFHIYLIRGSDGLWRMESM